MNIKLLIIHHLTFLSLKGGCTGSSESTLVKMPHCWKSHVMAQILHNKETNWLQMWSELVFCIYQSVQKCGMCDLKSLRSACAYAQSDQRLCLLLEYSMNIKLLIIHHLEFLSLKGGCTGSSESTLVKMPHCWKSHVMAQILHNKEKNWLQMWSELVFCIYLKTPCIMAIFYSKTIKL